MSYTDMCIFLMNSSEPGLQDDMRYMLKLSRDGQEALIVITKSDVADKDEDADGNLISVLMPKDDKTRRMQEDDICARVKVAYPEIDANQFRAISISTALAGEAIDSADDQKFKGGGLDKLMKILGDKVSDNAIARKQENPRRLLNAFVDSVVADLKSAVRSEVSARANDWNRQVKRGSSVSNDTISAEVSKILQDALNAEIDSQMRRVIEDFQSTEFKTVKANISTAALEKKTEQISHTYTESYAVPHPPDGFFEHIRSFFDKKFYNTEHTTRTEYQTIDLGTNIDEFLNSLMPQVESYAKSQAVEAVADLREKYFVERENFARRMRGEIGKLRGELLALKF